MGYEFEPLSGRIIEAALAVHIVLGPGFVEGIYENAFCVALERRDVPFTRQQKLEILFDGQIVGRHRLDLIVASSIVVELKSVRVLQEVHFAQLRSYLRASGLAVGLLFNFNAPTLAIRRVVV